jgi:hypothetical protein
MNMKSIVWVLAPLALSAGVIWLSAQDPKTPPGEGVRVGELAEKLQAREKALAQREGDLQQREQRLATLQGTLDKDRPGRRASRRPWISSSPCAPARPSTPS